MDKDTRNELLAALLFLLSFSVSSLVVQKFLIPYIYHHNQIQE